MNMVCISDCDGVLCDFQGAFDQYIMTIYPNGFVDKTTYNLSQRYQLTDDETQAALVRFAKEGGFKNLRRKAGAERVSILQPMIVTARPPEARADTAMWLLQNGIRFSGMQFTKDKAHFADKRYIVAYFEDHPVYAMDFAVAGVKVFLFSYPYNRHVKHPNIHRVSSWNDVPIEKIAEQLRQANEA